MKEFIYILLSLLVFQNCVWTNLNTERINLSEMNTNKAVSIKIDFDYNNRYSINLDYEHHKLSSMYIQSIRDLKIFDRVTYSDVKADYIINIKTTSILNSTGMLFYFLSAISLGIIPLYHNESMELNVELINSRTKNKSNINFPLDIKFISNIYATSHYRSFDLEEVSKAVVKKIIFEGIQSKVIDI
ncbi:hypothetical protein [Leptospira noguchii]|uniref:Uncharacterized protein n=1 Tax=Leptospira noguchii str. 2001034031 TaxID=1193053 RepID=M6YAQ8_9LEPT|nr:hypothetical protein [Leptospira noguchii]EMO90845.1 hypothetical protein LEP1GSC024_0082 [Leptospira noguchii str. 2001034031]